MDHARGLRKELEVEVFKENVVGRAFYARYGFELMQEKVHDQTGLEVMRLRLAANTRLELAP
jgi:putative acetyltransferase